MEGVILTIMKPSFRFVISLTPYHAKRMSELKNLTKIRYVTYPGLIK